MQTKTVKNDINRKIIVVKNYKLVTSLPLQVDIMVLVQFS